MKVLLINYEYPPLGGGAGNTSRYIGEWLSRFGCEVSVITMTFRTLPRIEVKNGVTIYRIPSLRRSLYKSNVAEMLSYIASCIWNRKSIYTRFHPDVAIAFLGIPSGLVAWWYKRTHKTPYILSILGGDVPGTQPEQLKLYHFLCKPIIKKIWLDAEFVVANSSGLRELARKTMTEKEILCIPNGIDTTIFRPPEKKISTDYVRLLYVGRVSFEKRLDILIEALAELKDLPWRLNIIGDGPHLKTVKSLVEKNELGARVTFLGWIEREQLINYYQQADVFVFPSTSEGMPTVVLEAMACGLPVITTRIPGCEELVLHEINGLLIEPRNKVQLIQALTRLINDAEIRSKFSSNSVTRAETFNWEKISRAYYDLLLKIVKTPL